MAITGENNVPNAAMEFIDSATGMLSKNKKSKEIVKLLQQRGSVLKLGSYLD